MADICVFYSRNEPERVEPVISVLTALGWTVWWDKDHHYGAWDARVEAEVREASCVILVWTVVSVEPDCLIRSEGKHAIDLGKPLFPVQLDDVTLPIQFNNLTTTRLTDWDGNASHPRFLELIGHLESISILFPLL